MSDKKRIPPKEKKHLAKGGILHLELDQERRSRVGKRGRAGRDFNKKVAPVTGVDWNKGEKK